MPSLAKRSTRRSGPLCFMHVPKCAGTSVHTALQAAFPPGSIASPLSEPPVYGDASVFCDVSTLERLPPEVRARVAVEGAQIGTLAGKRVVSGHFSLSTLLRVTPASHIATVLREPRARLLSAYMHMRLAPVPNFWDSYGLELLTDPERSFQDWLLAPSVAKLLDNALCRVILPDDPRLTNGVFAEPRHAEGLAEAVLEQLDRLGYVGILELDDIWDGMGRFFGATLEPTRANVSGAGGVPDGALPIPPFDMKVTLELMEQRTTADRLVYEELIVRRFDDSGEARRTADAALAAQLVNFGDLTGTSAAKLAGRGSPDPIADPDAIRH
jgi:hypothetical protein